ncbi:hypothetical protein FISHEDRAFT_44344, partial [Fistulina hepatica ATCC 64428]
VDPESIVSKTINSLQLSPTHPCFTFHFTDGSTFQILVQGYNPDTARRGVPSYLEMDPHLSDMLVDGAVPQLVGHTIEAARFITLQDRAFRYKAPPAAPSGLSPRRHNSWRDTEEEWIKDHLAFAFKVSGKWHCVWSMLEEQCVGEYANCVGNLGKCIFRDYDNVYLQERPPRSPQKSRFPRSPQKARDLSQSPKKARDYSRSSRKLQSPTKSYFPRASGAGSDSASWRSSPKKS